MAEQTLIIRLIADDKALLRAFSRSSRASKGFGHDMERAGRGALAASLSFRGLGRSLTFASAQFLGGAGIVFALKQVVSEASRVQEETEKTGIVFARSAPQVQAWAKTLANSFGIAEGAALEATGRFGNMLRPLGFAPAAAAKMSEALVQLSADMASFNNTKPDVILEALSSGLAGQVRPLRQYGVFLTQAGLQQEALAAGISKTGKNLTSAQKVQAAYNIIMKQTVLQQGDVARNTKSLSVAQSKLTASIQDLEARLGKALLPSITAYVNKAAAWLSQTENQEKIQRQLTSAVGAAVGVAKALASVAGTLRDVLAPVVRLVGGLKNALLGLVAIRLAATITGWIGSFIALGTGAEATRLKVIALRGALLRLAAIGVIAIGVEVLLNKDKIDQTVSNFLRSHKLGFLTGESIKLPVDASVEDIQKLRAQFATVKGENSLYVKSLDKLIAKLKEQRKAQDEAAASAAKAGKPIGTRRTVADTFGLPQAAPTAHKGITAQQRNQFFDASIGRAQDLVQDQTSIQRQISALQKIAGLIQARLAKTKDITRRLTLEGQLRDVFRQIKGDREQLAQDLTDALEAGNQKIADALSLSLDKAQATAGLADDLAALARINANLKARIKAEGETTDLARQLFENQQATAQALQEQRNRKQFRALGLSATGDQVIPGVANLMKQLKSLTARISGTKLDTSKLRSQLAGVRKVLSGELGKATAESRQKIAELFATIRQGFDQESGKGLGTKFHKASFKDVFSNVTGLTPEQIRRLRADFSRVGAGGTVPSGGGGAFGFSATGGAVVVHTSVNLDGRTVATNTTKHDQKRRRNNPPQRRGPQAGHR